MTTELLAQLLSLDVKLAIGADGRLTYDAPANVLNDELLVRMRADRDGLLALLAHQAESPYLEPILGIVCPWCSRGDHFTEKWNGIWCGRCERHAFLFKGQAIIRADWKDSMLL